MIDQKKQIRKEIIAQRSVLPAIWLEMSSAHICRVVELHEYFRTAQTVACFLSLPTEVNTQPLIDACWRRGVTLCVPAYDEERGVYRMSWLTPDDEMAPGPHQIHEPRHPKWIETDNLDLILVPGVAFDQSCYRLGFGGGHYDRILSQLKGCKMGLCFDFQVHPALPIEDHDQKLDCIMTEKSFYDGKRVAGPISDIFTNAYKPKNENSREDTKPAGGNYDNA